MTRLDMVGTLILLQMFDSASSIIFHFFTCYLDCHINPTNAYCMLAKVQAENVARTVIDFSH